MFTSSTAIAALVAILKPLAEALFSAIGVSLNDYLAGGRADQNAKELGAAQAQLGTAKATIAAQQAQLDAQAKAPTSTDEAIRRLEEGSA